MADNDNSEGFVFSREGAGRVVKTVRRMERSPRNEPFRPDYGSDSPENFSNRIVKITAIPGAAKGKYTGNMLTYEFILTPLPLSFYSLGEIISGTVDHAVGDFVLITRCAPVAINSALGITIAAGDNWVLADSKDRDLTVEESDGSPTLKNPAKLWFHQDTFVCDLPAADKFQVKSKLEIDGDTGVVQKVGKATFTGTGGIVCTVTGSEPNAVCTVDGSGITGTGPGVGLRADVSIAAGTGGTHGVVDGSNEFRNKRGFLVQYGSNVLSHVPGQVEGFDFTDFGAGSNPASGAPSTPFWSCTAGGATIYLYAGSADGKLYYYVSTAPGVTTVKFFLMYWIA